jgi:hypothetical protein
MKNLTLIIATSALLYSCGGVSWNSYYQTCVVVETISITEKMAIEKCNCTIEKYKAAGLKPTDMDNTTKVSEVNITECGE